MNLLKMFRPCQVQTIICQSNVDFLVMVMGSYQPTRKKSWIVVYICGSWGISVNPYIFTLHRLCSRFIFTQELLYGTCCGIIFISFCNYLCNIYINLSKNSNKVEFWDMQNGVVKSHFIRYLFFKKKTSIKILI
jgi:hypothetical protein